MIAVIKRNALLAVCIVAATGIGAYLAISIWDVSVADSGHMNSTVTRAPDSAPTAASQTNPPTVLTPAEEALVVEVESTWKNFLDKAANNDKAALGYLAPHLRSEYANPEVFAALSKMKSLQKDFGVLEVKERYARLATVLTHQGPDSLHYVTLEKRRGQWFIISL